MIDFDHSTPSSFARYLASYVSDPSTIRARTIDQFGRAPSVDECRAMREAHLSIRKQGERKMESRADHSRYSRKHLGDQIAVVKGDAALRDYMERASIAFMQRLGGARHG